MCELGPIGFPEPVVKRPPPGPSRWSFGVRVGMERKEAPWFPTWQSSLQGDRH